MMSLIVETEIDDRMFQRVRSRPAGNQVGRMRRGQRGTTAAVWFRCIMKLELLVLVRMQPAQTAGVWRLGGERFQQGLKDAERDNKQQ
jgi:hypothetical protein